MRTFDQLFRRATTLESERANFDNIRQEIADHLFGERDFQVKRTPGENRRRLIYDSTALFSWKILSSAIFNFLASPDRENFDLTTEDLSLMEDPEVRGWVQESQDRLFALIARPASGFSTAMQEFFDDLTGFAMAAVFVEDVPGLPIRYSARPLSEIYVAESPSGRVDTVFRKFELTNRQAVDRFGRGPLSRILGKMDRFPDEKTTFWHATHRTDDPLFNGTERLPFRSVFFSLEEKNIVEERLLRRQPFKVARWSKKANEPYGSGGPGHIALSDGRMLNAMSKTLLENAQLKARPPVAVADDDVINPLNLNPEGQNVVRAAGFSTDPIRLLQTTGDTGLAVEMFDRRKQAVRSAFMHDLLEILQQPINTATQVIEMVQKARSLLAPTVSRLQAEAFEPVIDDSFLIALDAGAFPPVPPILRGQNLKVVYRNPVARSQREDETRAIDDFIGFALNVSQVRPTVLDNIDFDAVLRERHKATGAPERLLNTQRKVEAIREQQARFVEQQQQQEQIAQGAESLGKAAPALKLLQGGAEAA